MKKTIQYFVSGIILLTASFCYAVAPEKIWNIPELEQVPKAEWKPVVERVALDDQGKEVPVETQKVYYENGTWRGKPIRIMAFFSKPKGAGPFPGIVLIHGGGGTAYSCWTEKWAAHGYAAISMDLGGQEVVSDFSCEANETRQDMPDGGPAQTDENKFCDFSIEDNGYCDTWTYQSIAAIMRAHSLLDSLPSVDPARTAATGISWGGYLACILAGVDHRFQTIVPVYGCGNLWKNSFWTVPCFSPMSPEAQERWNEYCDPVSFLKYATCPVFLMAGTDDLAYPLVIHRDTWQTYPTADVRLEVYMRHSHTDGWAPKEIAAYIDAVLNHAEPLPCLEPIELTRQEDGSFDIHAAYKYKVKPQSASLFYSTGESGYDDQGNLRKSEWTRIDAAPLDDGIHATLPASITAPVRFFLQAVDSQGRSASTHYAELP